jgi:cell division protein FtsL
MSEAVQRTVIKISGFVVDRPRLTPVFIAIVLVAVLSLVFVWSRLQAINLEYDISRIESQIRADKEDIKGLSLEVAHLGSHQRIESLARQELGLRLPTPGQIIRVD